MYLDTMAIRLWSLVIFRAPPLLARTVNCEPQGVLCCCFYCLGGGGVGGARTASLGWSNGVFFFLSRVTCDRGMCLTRFHFFFLFFLFPPPLVVAGLVLRVFRPEVNISDLAGGVGGGRRVGGQVAPWRVCVYRLRRFVFRQTSSNVHVPFVPSVQRPIFFIALKNLRIFLFCGVVSRVKRRS